MKWLALHWFQLWALDPSTSREGADVKRRYAPAAKPAGKGAAWCKGTSKACKQRMGMHLSGKRPVLAARHIPAQAEGCWPKAWGCSRMMCFALMVSSRLSGQQTAAIMASGRLVGCHAQSDCT